MDNTHNIEAKEITLRRITRQITESISLLSEYASLFRGMRETIALSEYKQQSKPRIKKKPRGQQTIIRDLEQTQPKKTILNERELHENVFHNRESLKIKPPSKNELLILGALNRLGSAHAPSISKSTDNQISVASIYTLLQRLERKGLVKRRDVTLEFEGIGVKRVFYELTATGNLFIKHDKNSNEIQNPSRQEANYCQQET